MLVAKRQNVGPHGLSLAFNSAARPRRTNDAKSGIETATQWFRASCQWTPICGRCTVHAVRFRTSIVVSPGPGRSKDGAIVDYLKGLLSGIASLILAVLVPSFVFMVREMSRSKTTGLGAVAGRFTGSLVSSAFLALVLLFILLFYASSRLKSEA